MSRPWVSLRARPWSAGTYSGTRRHPNGSPLAPWWPCHVRSINRGPNPPPKSGDLRLVVRGWDLWANARKLIIGRCAYGSGSLRGSMGHYRLACPSRVTDVGAGWLGPRGSTEGSVPLRAGSGLTGTSWAFLGLPGPSWPLAGAAMARRVARVLGRRQGSGSAACSVPAVGPESANYNPKGVSLRRAANLLGIA